MPGSTLTKSPTFTTLTSESGNWSLQTLATTEPCGYTIVVQASDNTIVDSGSVGWYHARLHRPVPATRRVTADPATRCV